MNELLKLIESACNIIAPSGYENRMNEFIKSYIKDNKINCTVENDSLGNIVCTFGKHDTQKSKIALIAHIDSAGIFVLKEEHKTKWGSLSTWTEEKINNQPIELLSGGRLIANYENNELVSDSTDQVYTGDVGTLSPCFETDGNFVTATFLDNRISCCCFLKVMREIVSTNEMLSFIFTTQEEIGNKGAKAIAREYDFDNVYVVDTTIGSMNYSDCLPVLGSGVCYKICDGSGICNEYLNKEMICIANDKGIKMQKELLTFAGSDIIAFSDYNNNCKFTGISVPCQNMHTRNEKASIFDISSLYELIKALLHIKCGVIFEN